MIKQIINYSIMFISIICLLIISLYIITLIPKECIENNVIESEKQLEKWEVNPKIGTLKPVVLDNYTDIVMVNTAYSVDTKKPFESIMLSRRSYDSERNLEERNKYNYQEIERPILDLKETIEKRNTQYEQYARYWHGYLVFLRPLLAIFNYLQIRIILMLVLNILIIVLVYLVYKKVNKIISVIMTILFFSLSYQYAGLSVTYFSVLAISIIMSIVVVIKKEINYKWYFIIGGITSFMDLLTAPLLTLTMPLLMYLIVKNKQISYKQIFIPSINWVLGFTLVWASKWILADIFFQRNIIEDALNQLTKRTGRSISNINITIFETIWINIQSIKYEIVILSITTIYFIILSKIEKIQIPKKETIQYIIIAVMPIVWYAFTQNHSYIHGKYTYRNMYVTMLSFGVLSYKMIKEYIKEYKRGKTISKLVIKSKG